MKEKLKKKSNNMRELLIEKFDGPYVMHNGATYWFNKFGNYHRENDMPAWIRSSGTKFWYINGKPHRDNDKPATIYESGKNCWYNNGKRHRSNNKPAVIYSDGRKEWWINGKFITRNYYIIVCTNNDGSNFEHEAFTLKDALTGIKNGIELYNNFFNYKLYDKFNKEKNYTKLIFINTNTTTKNPLFAIFNKNIFGKMMIFYQFCRKNFFSYYL